MKTRILTALLLFPPAIYLIGWSPLWLFAAVVALVGVLALREYFAICRLNGHKVYEAIAYVCVVAQCIVLVMFLERGEGRQLPAITLLLALLAFVAPLASLNLTQHVMHPLAPLAKMLLGILYIGWPLSFLILIRFMDPASGFHWIFLLFVVIWAGDIFAYFVGRAVGRHLLAPRVSPKKTWEGSLAGFLGSIVAAWAYTHWTWELADKTAVLILAGLIAVAGQLGDLAESALKRGAGIKDSGRILPGHGGILDRIDALLFGSAFLWLALALRDLGVW